MIYGFIHVYTVNNWQEIFENQLMRLNRSRLLGRCEKIFVGINGNAGNWINSLSDKIQVVYQFDKPELEQSLTLSFIRFFAITKVARHTVFYIHTKGVTHNSATQNDWRNLMEYFTIDRHEKCVEELEKSDIVGVNWHLGEGYMGATSKKALGAEVTPHFSGNFWWANTNYLTKLPPLYPLDSKYQCEFWIGKGNPKVSELWRSGIHHHRHQYSESNYIGKEYVRYYTGANQIRN
jgi:hypothetical protein